VSWADRIAYVCHDFEDAVAAGVVAADQLPEAVVAVGGARRSGQLGAFIQGMVDAGAATGRIGMTADQADALAVFRRFNYEQIYLRPESVRQADAVIDVLRALVEHYAEQPDRLPAERHVEADAGSPDALRAAVTYVGGMTDRYAFQQAVHQLGWAPEQLPRGI
jgi:dGTPase